MILVKALSLHVSIMMSLEVYVRGIKNEQYVIQQKLEKNALRVLALGVLTVISVHTLIFLAQLLGKNSHRNSCPKIKVRRKI